MTTATTNHGLMDDVAKTYDAQREAAGKTSVPAVKAIPDEDLCTKLVPVWGFSTGDSLCIECSGFRK